VALPRAARPIAPPVTAPFVRSTGLRLRTPIGPVSIRSDYVPRPEDIVVPEQFRYSDDQIRDMLQRGASETFERSGETDSGLFNSPELEQKANESDATKQFGRESAGGTVPPGNLPGTTDTEKDYRWLLAAAAAYFMFS